MNKNKDISNNIDVNYVVDDEKYISFKNMKSTAEYTMYKVVGKKLLNV